MGEYEKKYNELEDGIIKELAKETPLSEKIIKIKPLVLMIHSIFGRRFSPQYQVRVEDFKKRLQVDVNLYNSVLQQKRLDLLMEWLNLIQEEYPLYDLHRNWQRVDFGD